MSTQETPNPAGPGSPRAKAAAPATRKTQQEAGAWNPFERIYTPAGDIDREYAGKRLPTLVDLIRKHRACHTARVDLEKLTSVLMLDDAAGLRDAADQEAFEAALRRLSEAHLHEIVDPGMQQELASNLLELARDESLTRRDRAAAALGVALVSVPPDSKGLRGRGLMDVILRVTMEEQNAQESLRRRAREVEGGLTSEELTAFWAEYPALRWRYEERNRREVGHVLKAIESDSMPPAVSVDLGLRGASKLLAEVAKAKAEGADIDARRAEEVLRAPFVLDMAEDGALLVAERWRSEMANPEGGTSDERRAVVRSLEMGTRLVEILGPGTDPILFYLYMRAVVQGHYYVRDEEELEAAKALFGAGGLVAAGALTYAAHLAARGEKDAERRTLLAAIEIWPEHAGVRAAAEDMGRRVEADHAAARLGPKYEEARKDRLEASVAMSDDTGPAAPDSASATTGAEAAPTPPDDAPGTEGPATA